MVWMLRGSGPLFARHRSKAQLGSWVRASAIPARRRTAGARWRPSTVVYGISGLLCYQHREQHMDEAESEAVVELEVNEQQRRQVRGEAAARGRAQNQRSDHDHQQGAEQ